MGGENKLNPGHRDTRRLLRVAGPSLVAIGALLLLVGVGSFFLGLGGFGMPKLFFLAFLGMPVLFIGTALSMFGFMGAATRYQAAEMAPVAKDAFNYMAEETRPGVSAVASAVGAGLAEGLSGDSTVVGLRVCTACTAENDAAARFCDACGAALPHARYCANCGTENDPDAHFCDHCGAACE